MVDRGESTGTGARTEVISPARVSARVGAIEESATLAISTRAKALRAQGVHVVDFGAGEPDFPTPPHIVEAASRACADPRNHKYTANAGLPELREAVAEKTRQDTGLHVEPAQVLVTNGGKQSVYQAFATLLDPGDEVLIPAPYWVTYPEAVRLAGGVPVPVETGPGAGFEVSVDALEAAAGERTKVLLFVSPSNPTGVVYPRDHAVEIGRWAAARGLWVVTDEIYQHLVYPPHEFSSLPVEVPELAERSIVISGVSKTYAMTGWRVGWMIGPGDAITAAANLQSHLTSNVNNVAQVAAMAALTGPQDDVARMREAFAARRAMLLGGLRAIAGVECVEPGGAFYAFPSLTGLLGRDLGGATAGSTLELGSLLLDRAGVAVVPGEAFGTPGYARMAYALSESELGEGIERIRALAES